MHCLHALLLHFISWRSKRALVQVVQGATWLLWKVWKECVA